MGPSDETVSEERLASIPQHLRIKVLYKDEAVIVIEKPSNLRSVAGHANAAAAAAAATGNIGPAETSRMTAQEAWISAIRSFRDMVITDNDESSSSGSSCHSVWLRNLATRTTNLSSVPRKWSPFRRYCQRNQQTLSASIDSSSPLMSSSSLGDDAQGKSKRRKVSDSELDSIAMQMYGRIKARQVPLMNLPKATEHEESAFGQLVLYGYANEEFSFDEDCSSAIPKQLFVVHRLDCETSGVMVFARDRQSASVLSQAWRERDQVSKKYLARVKHWPPFHVGMQREGRIDAPMAPSEERLKWQVQANGKSSTTLWKVREPACRLGHGAAAADDDDDASKEGHESDSVVLELTPVSGRTHQLRVHCAHVGSGIEGDSLYGDERIEWKPTDGSKVLCLHSHVLSFPHPVSGERMELATMPTWYDETPVPAKA